jgi:DNA-binding MarR family transcriptional regulator
MDENKVAAIQEIVLTIRQLVSVVHSNSPKMKKQSGLTGPQAEALRILSREGPLSSVELSRKLFVTPSNITGIIDRLKKKELVERVRGVTDRRVSRLELTLKGRVAAESLPSSLEGKLINGLLDLEEEKILQMADQLKTILDLIRTPEGMSKAVKEPPAL